ncbi:hypothetical protein Tco_1231147 [Tanacetum coccineum]
MPLPSQQFHCLRGTTYVEKQEEACPLCRSSPLSLHDRPGILLYGSNDLLIFRRGRVLKSIQKGTSLDDLYNLSKERGHTQKLVLQLVLRSHRFSDLEVLAGDLPLVVLLEVIGREVGGELRVVAGAQLKEFRFNKEFNLSICSIFKSTIRVV